MKNVSILFFLIALSAFPQTNVSGKISDNNSNPIRNVNVIAAPKSNTGKLHFSTTNTKGEFAFTLDKNSTYEITVSYLGYFEQKLIIDANSENKTHSLYQIGII